MKHECLICLEDKFRSQGKLFGSGVDTTFICHDCLQDEDVIKEVFGVTTSRELINA